MAVYDNSPGAIVAAAQGALAGGFVASTSPYNVTSIGAPASSVYLVTLADAIDALWAIPMVSGAVINRAAIAAQASDTTVNVTTFDQNTGGATDAIFNFMMIRTRMP